MDINSDNGEPSDARPNGALTADSQHQREEERELQLGQEERPPPYSAGGEDIVQVVYHSNQNGSLVGIESSFVAGSQPAYLYSGADNNFQSDELAGQPLRPSSTLPSVAEESTTTTNATSGSGGAGACCASTGAELELAERAATGSGSSAHFYNDVFAPTDNNPSPSFQPDDYSNAPTGTFYEDQQQQFGYNPNAIYSTINRHQRLDPASQEQPQQQQNEFSIESSSTSFYTANCNTLSNQEQQHQQVAAGESVESSQATLQNKHSPIKELQEEEGEEGEEEAASAPGGASNLIDLANPAEEVYLSKGEQEDQEEEEEEEEEKENFGRFLSRQKGGAAESGSFRHNFRKKLGVSVSSNENELIAHRQKLLEEQEEAATGKKASSLEVEGQEADELGSLPSKFKRTHSVSFNVGSSRSSRHSVDIRNLPSYLTHKRASIVDVAKGAMSSLMHSLGASNASASSHRRDSSMEEPEEPIFEEPIAPTLSLGQRVALVRNSGAEFGTVGWIGQLPDVDDDWIVGVIFDNMIGNCDGEHMGVRYFYARENYAMFVPLSSLTKTDNYIGRPETGTMLSRMSVSLKPGQLISIHRSSIRLQHCFLNAPHQRVGHDVRAVSNRLHCQCHNCGPCAHLTKQGRLAGPPLLSGHHHAANKKNSLAHMAVELLAHHHHHYHDEEEHEEEDHQFGDNSAHACNFVRYSCCQQSGTAGHDFSADCQMVRPELLDNLIHAPRAPHRRSRPRRSRQPRSLAGQQKCQPHQPQLTLNDGNIQLPPIDKPIATLESDTIKRASPSTIARSEESSSYSSSSYSSSRSSSPQDAAHHSPDHQYATQTYQNNLYNYNLQTTTNGNGAYSTIESQMSLLDQRKFINRRESDTYRSRQSNTSDEYYYTRSTGGFASSIKRCFFCIIGRKQRSSRRKPKKRKLSSRNRLIEYRRRQSTFVPSTLAKPQEDFASHGIILSPVAPQLDMGNAQNSDYSTRSSSSSSNTSRSHSPDLSERRFVAETHQHPTMIYEQQADQKNQQLKSSTPHDDRHHSQNINYGDYTLSDNYSIYQKDPSCSQESDLGYNDTWSKNSHSNDTLKHIVDQSINEQEPLGNEIPQLDSPILSNYEDHPSEHLDISSPTASILNNHYEFDGNQDQPEVGEEFVNQMNNLNLNNFDQNSPL